MKRIFGSLFIAMLAVVYTLAGAPASAEHPHAEHPSAKSHKDMNLEESHPSNGGEGSEWGEEISEMYGEEYDQSYDGSHSKGEHPSSEHPS